MPAERAAHGGALRACVRGLLAVSGGLLLGLCPLASGPASSGVLPLPYAPRSAHQAYGYSLAIEGLRTNPLALEWLEAGERALFEPEPLAAPFDVLHTLPADKPGAAGFAFEARDGQRLSLLAQPSADLDAELFVDVYRSTPLGLEYVTSGLPGGGGARPVELEVLEPARYVLRVQPALVAGVNETPAELGVQVRVQTSPLLGFPVEGADVKRIWSGFGAERDGGARSHRGVDIFVPRGTPAVAAVDGWVTRVDDTPRGGKVVWLQPLFGGMRLYYAHLDEQWVERGQFVQAGEPIGAVGNTGNAKTTPPHLHFGVYVRQPGVRGGARDPIGYLR